MRFCIDYLAGAKYRNIIAKEHLPNWGAGFFANTFGNAWPSIEKLLATGKCPLVRIHAIWEDNHKYDPKKHDQLILKELNRANKLKDKFPNVHVQFSPFCEPANSIKEILDKCGDASKNVEIVSSIFRNEPSKKFMNEIHGGHAIPKRGAYQYSYDGTNCVDSNVEADKAKHKDAQNFFFWHVRFNLKWSMKDTTPRPLRKAKPDSNLIRSVVYLANNKGNTKLPKTWLLKSHAEKHGPEDLKGDKLLIISPIKAKEIILKAKDGSIVDKLVYYGTFSGGGYRYYSKTFGYLVSELAIKKSGSPVCQVVIDNKIHGFVNPAFRDSTFR